MTMRTTMRRVAVFVAGAMPAKGGNPALSDGDVAAAVDFMLDAVK